MNHLEQEQLADALLVKLRRKPKHFFPESQLTKELKTTSADFQAALKLLKTWGYEITKNAKEAYAFHTPPDTVTATEIAYGLKTKLIGKTAHSYHTVKSTNDIATQLAEQGVKEGTIVTAETQTKGRGRLGRSWHSPAGMGIYLSIILRPKFLPEDAPGVSLMTALALADTFSKYCRNEVGIKWPNDLLLNGKKTAGILTELSAERGKINHLIVGVGMNINHTTHDFPPELRMTATSLRRFVKRKIDRLELLRLFLLNFEKEYARYTKDRLKPSQKRLLKYSTLIGKRIKLDSGKVRIEGECIDIDQNGNLILEENKKRTIVSSGEVTVVKE
jgi:BirA family biotin operon repressor/biotin-[acetyl-CoA-carboxylase] ligase